MIDNIYYYEPEDVPEARYETVTCPHCDGTGIDPEAGYDDDPEPATEKCPRCGGEGTVEVEVEYDPYEDADEWYDARCDRW